MSPRWTTTISTALPISDLVLSALESGADIVGKRATFFHFEDGQEYCVRYPDSYHRWLWPSAHPSVCPSSAKVAGATMLVRSDAIRRFPFDERAPQGTDSLFQASCRAAGMTTYASDEFNFCYFRRTDNAGHLWQAQKAKILKDGFTLASFERSQVCA
jgi:hypothetical protein